MKTPVTAIALLLASCGTSQQTQVPAQAAPVVEQAPLAQIQPVPPANTVVANVANVARPPVVAPSPFAPSWTCEGDTSWGLHVTYSIATNSYGDIIGQADVSDGNRTVTRTGFLAAETYRNRTVVNTHDRMIVIPDFARGGSNTHQTALSFAKGVAYVADEYLNITPVTKQTYLTVANAATIACQPATGALTLGGAPHAFGRIVHNAYCGTTMDAAIASYVDLTYSIAWDDSGRTLVVGTAAAREEGGIVTDVMVSDAGVVGDTVMDVQSNTSAAGTYETGYNAQTFSLSYGKDGQVQTNQYVASDYTTHNCLDWYPR